MQMDMGRCRSTSCQERVPSRPSSHFSPLTSHLSPLTSHLSPLTSSSPCRRKTGFWNFQKNRGRSLTEHAQVLISAGFPGLYASVGKSCFLFRACLDVVWKPLRVRIIGSDAGPSRNRKASGRNRGRDSSKSDFLLVVTRRSQINSHPSRFFSQQGDQRVGRFDHLARILGRRGRRPRHESPRRTPIFQGRTVRHFFTCPGTTFRVADFRP
jgi:hypothetical protein